MKIRLRRTVASLLVCLLLLLGVRPARADSLSNAVTETIIAIVAVTAAITVGVVYAIRHDPSLRGCTSSGASGLMLSEEDGKQMWSLVGDISAIKPGDRIKVTGKKKKKDAAANRTFVVSKLNKDYGACQITP